MDYNIKIIKNRLNVDVSDDLAKFKTYIEEKTPLKVTFSVVESDFDLVHKPYGIRTINDGVEKNLWGLDGARKQVAESGLISNFFYHTAILLYNLEDTDTSFIDSKNGIAHWAHFSQVVPGTEFIEIATKPVWDDLGDVFRVLTHEIFHAWHYRARRRGIPTIDSMDEYDQEFDVLAPTGNRERNLAVLLPHFEVIASRPLLLIYIKLLIAQVQLLLLKLKLKKQKETQTGKGESVLNPPKTVSRLDDWANAIQLFEGWFVGSRSHRNNNPGNLRWSKYMIGKDSGNFAIFKDYATGFKALKFQLTISADGRSSLYRPDMTLEQFFMVYAPASDNNHPKIYAKFVADKLGVPVETQIKTLLG